MSVYSLSHLSDQDLLHGLASAVAGERTGTAVVLAHIAEVDARRLYVPAGFPSMYEYCLRKLRWSEQAAMKRIRAARTARRLPAIFEAVAEGRLHLSAVVLLTPHLTPDNAAELVAAAADHTKAEIEEMLAARFPRADVPARIEPLAPPARPSATAEPMSLETVETPAAQLSPGTPCDPPAPGHDAPLPQSKVKPLSPERFLLQCTIEKSAHDDLQYAQVLLSHAIPSGDVAKVIARALKALVRELEKRRFAATDRPRPRQRRSTANHGYIPAEVRRAVWKRDGGQCTFMGPAEQRCPARSFLQFDHIDPVALGGQATVENLRLRCASHNQFAAECAFGTEFMKHKREEARRARAEARAEAARRAAEEQKQAAAAAERAKELDVVPWLRELGFRADQARRAAVHCDDVLPDGPLEERLRAALRFLGGAPCRRWRPSDLMRAQ